MIPSADDAIKFGKAFGFQSLLLSAVVVFGAWFMTSSFMTHEAQINLRLEQQNKRIEDSENFIRTELLGIQQRTVEVAHECAEALKCNAAALERNSTALDHLISNP